MDLKFEVKSFVVFASPLFQILGFPFFNSSAVRSLAHFASGHRAMTARNNKATNRDSKLSSRKCRQ
jgi:hypothetical protein